MGRPNCTRPLAYSTARSQAHWAMPTCRAAVSTAPSRRHQAATSGPATGSPAGSDGHRPHRGERVHGTGERGGRPATPGRVGRCRRRRAPAGRRGRPGARRPPAARRCPTAPGAGRSTSPTTTEPSSAPSTSPAARWEATSGPGHQRAAELLEDERGLGESQADAAGLLGQAQVEDAGIAQLLPAVAVDHVRRSTRGRGSTRAGTGPRTAGGCRRPARTGTRRPRSPSAQPFPAGGRLGLLGQPQDALADDVPLDLRRAGGDGQRDPPQPVLDHGPGREQRRARRCPRGRGRPGRPGRAATARTRRACGGSRSRPA